jgi:hypothetical protein
MRKLEDFTAILERKGSEVLGSGVQGFKGSEVLEFK